MNRKRIRKIFVLCFVLLVLVAGTKTEARAASTIAEGKCGDNVTWMLDSNYKLILSGTGETWSWTGSNAADYPPWYEDYHGLIKTVVTNNGITGLGDGLFYKCTSLQNVNLNDGIESLGAYIFSNCSSLKSIQIPESVTSVGEQAFWKSGLTSVNFPGNIKNMDEQVFGYCTSLQTVAFSGEMEVIPRESFYGCISLRDVSWPKNLKKIAPRAFYCCFGLTNAAIPEGVTEIGDEVFSMDPGSDQNLVIYETMTGSKSMTSASIPGTVTRIGSSIFKNCSSLRTVKIASGVPEIPQMAFYGCGLLKQVELPASVTDIKYQAFYGCSSLGFVEFLNENVVIADSAFTNAGSSKTVAYGMSESEASDIAVNRGWIFKAFDKASSYQVELGYEETVYNGNAKKPSAQVSFDGKELEQGTDYTLSYKKNIDAGKAAVVIKGKGKYQVSFEKTFKITPKKISKCVVTLSTTSYTYNGSYKKPTVKVKDDGEILEKGTDYTVKYQNNLKAGTASVIVTGIGNYKGQFEKTFTIKKAAPGITASNYKKVIGASAFTVKVSRKGTGKLMYKSSKPSVAIVSSSGKVKIKGYGKTTITIKTAATVNYKAGEKKITVMVVPKKAVIYKASSVTGKKIKITWKVSSDVTGYNFQISTTKNFTSDTKKVNYLKKESGSKILGILEKNKTYYIRTRAYKTVNGVKYYGAWSEIKSVKIVR